jgi:23S rRNA pseudouridine1911/1915/1917 synthase
MSQNPDRIFFCEILKNHQDIRLDVFLCNSSMGLSRSRIQSLIKDGHARVNDCPSKASYKLKAGDRVFFAIPPPSEMSLTPDDVEFEVVYEDDALIVLSKPAGVVVHPGAGHSTKTLVHGLLKHCKDLSGIGGTLRPGIVHRLDKNTSGLMVVAKNDLAHTSLSAQFKAGLVKKEYLALVHGYLTGEKGEIALPIARHPVRRKEMAVVPSGGRHALSLWRKLMEFQSGFSLLSVSIRTGRTHQIRVHLSHIGHPVAGDPVYGCRRDRRKKSSNQHPERLPDFDRQMLHSSRLGFIHPVTQKLMAFESALPCDMKHALDRLKLLDLQQ